MNNRFAIPVLLWMVFLLGGMAFSQSRTYPGKLNLALQSALRNGDPDRMVDLLVRGDVEGIQIAARASEGVIKHTMKGLVSLSLPASEIPVFAAHPSVEFVEYRNSKLHVLNDMMLLNNNVAPVHAGMAPLPQAYTGEDVIIGIIDTGIELGHPDFQDAQGNTRVLALWDQTVAEDDPFRIPQPYGYGQEWTAEDIDANVHNHDDPANYFGHGSTVAGVATGNAGASGELPGVAPDADIIVVASDLDRENWSGAMVDAVDYIFERADALGKPVVINISLGDYFGSHDALDGATLFIESLIDAQPGRSVVAAAGNSANFPPYHLAYDVPQTDTAFTWMRYHPNSLLGEGAVFFELWADSVTFAQTRYSVGADLTTPEYEFMGYVSWRDAVMNTNTIITDTLMHNGNILGIVDTWAGRRGDQYLVQVAVTQPFSNQYRWRFATTGGGRFDVWSHGPFGTSVIEFSQLPDEEAYPPMQHYRYPDKESTIVDAWACSDMVITVGNYTNRNSFVNYTGGTTEYPDQPGAISINSSGGPTRDLRLKPDVAASGDQTLSAGRLATLNSYIINTPNRVSSDGWHYVNGGTSIASPVVAGVAALYLSRDPEADWLEIKNAIVENAVADPFTGALPNQRFGNGKIDAFATLTQPFTTGVRTVEYNAISVYPNPTTNSLFLASGQDRLYSATIYDTAGRLVTSVGFSNSRGSDAEVDVSGLQPGIYLLVVQYRDGGTGQARFAVGR